MPATVADVQSPRLPAVGDVSGLRDRLAVLIGEPFGFARFTYGDELTLHFGELSPIQHPKLKHLLCGAFMLGVRCSAWLIKAGDGSQVLAAGLALGETPLDKKAVVANPLITPDARVTAATPFPVLPAQMIGLELKFSDGASLVVLPPPPEPEDPDEAGLPEIADWELFTPGGHLTAGPGLNWSFTPKSA